MHTLPTIGHYTFQFNHSKETWEPVGWYYRQYLALDQPQPPHLSGDFEENFYLTETVIEMIERLLALLFPLWLLIQNGLNLVRVLCI